eukprot:6469608-Amphidinium_carterae.1
MDQTVSPALTKWTSPRRRPPLTIAPSGARAHGHSWYMSGGGSLAEAQSELSRYDEFELHRATGDGSCFFHMLRVAGITELPVQNLREILQCPSPQEATEEHVLRAAFVFQVCFEVIPSELTDGETTLAFPFTRFVGDASALHITVVNWTRNDVGYHFDYLERKDDWNTMSYYQLRRECSSRAIACGASTATMMRTALRQFTHAPPVPSTEHQCPRCPAGFPTFYLLTQHKKHCIGRTQPEEHEVICPNCRSLVSRNRVAQHRARFHSDKALAATIPNRVIQPSLQVPRLDATKLESLRIMQFNIRGHASNRAEFEQHVVDHGVHVVCLQETWWTSKVSQTSLPPNYVLGARKDRCNGQHGGGVAILLHKPDIRTFPILL